MRRTLARVLLIVLLMAGASYSQSLADVARQNRANKDNNATAAKKVYTTDDLSPTPTASPVVPGQTPEVWTRQILWQKKWVAYLQAQADKLNARSNVGFNGEHPSDAQVAKVQSELTIEKTKLEAMQQAAQHAGMPSTVYDPKTPIRINRSNAGTLRYMRSLSQH